MKGHTLVVAIFCGVLGVTPLVVLVSALWARASPANASAPVPAIQAWDDRLVSAPFTTTGPYTIFLPLIRRYVPPPAIACFNATPATVNLGNSTVLSWCVTGAVSMTLNPGSRVVNGASTIVIPAVTTVYTLSAFNSAGVVTRTTTVTVPDGGQCGNIGGVQAWEGTLCGL